MLVLSGWWLYTWGAARRDPGASDEPIAAGNTLPQFHTSPSSSVTVNTDHYILFVQIEVWWSPCLSLRVTHYLNNL